MEIKAKYSKGDKVYSAETEYKDKWIACPDCLGTCKWLVVFADGEVVEVECQTCRRGYEPAKGEINVKSFSPEVKELTIGSVRFDDTDKHPFSYMCEETGIGSGRIYYEEDLFTDSVEAAERAKVKNEEQMISIAQNNYSKKFGGTKEIESALSTWGFSRKMQIEKAEQFRNWAKLSGIIKKESK